MRQLVITCIALLVARQGVHASERDQALRTLGMAFAHGQCSVVLMKEGETTVTPGHYIADNLKLHQCQYVQEMLASPCVELKTCPAYETWAKAATDFSPSMPRAAFEKTLDSRRAMVAALRAAR